MPNHPNRSGKSPARNPTPAEIRQAREAAGLTQPEAAALIHSTLRTWQDWEAGIARMHAGLWELFRRKAQPATCSTCSHWQPYAEDFPNAAPDTAKESGGICKSKLMREEWDDDYPPNALVYSYCEDGYFWTGPDFGCVNHSQK